MPFVALSLLLSILVPYTTLNQVLPDADCEPAWQKTLRTPYADVIMAAADSKGWKAKVIDAVATTSRELLKTNVKPSVSACLINPMKKIHSYEIRHSRGPIRVFHTY